MRTVGHLLSRPVAIGTALVLVMLIAGFVGWRLTGGGEYVAPTPSAAPTVRADTVAGRDSLEELVAGVRDGAKPEGKGAAAVATRNADAIGIEGLSARYVAESGNVDEDGSWTADVDMSWRAPGDPTLSEELKVGFDGDGEITGFSADEGTRMPLWLSGPVEVRRTGSTLVVVQASAEQADRYAELAASAVKQVRTVIGWDRPRLVLEVPASGLDSALGAQPSTYSSVAAVTATVDGSSTAGSPLHVWVNQDVIGDLDSPGAQVVITHEAVHAATAAPTNPHRPMWLVEGYADYVALRDTTLPLSKTAGQILAQVREDGPPKHLPGKAEFNTRSEHFGAEYEAAWLACVVLAEAGGQEALVDLYEQTGRGVPLERALRASFGFGVDELTARWRTHLSDSAR
ncbi:hypothetical protein FB381_3179 [Nocardioides albertanoniae]|uniref:Peptidase MA superfamily protein n=1 Tax=Nocardioides albertanoniae TaxID=1175486 RepID=A0A543A9I0_9ACTN|nr:hypothetical protein [Nocardioides albertanoniae]TQL69274.1 hypothetical protein FB381_3179 [Nocardioides albertanoniae]